MSEYNVKLSPPQYSLYRKLLHSIGQTPGVEVQEPIEQNGVWLIHITAEQANRASALASVLIDSYDFGGIRVFVRVSEVGHGPIILSAIALDRDLRSSVKEMILIALAGNRYFVRVEEMSGMLAVLFRPRVIQFWNDNLADPYGYEHYVAQDVFAEVMRSEYPGQVRVLFTTVIR